VQGYDDLKPQTKQKQQNNPTQTKKNKTTQHKQKQQTKKRKTTSQPVFHFCVDMDGDGFHAFAPAAPVPMEANSIKIDTPLCNSN
jgi:hypothetical protein